jgi:WW domain-binding protein 4
MEVMSSLGSVQIWKSLCSIAYPVLVSDTLCHPQRSTLPMSEYWVSKKRYFCKYCDVYIADDVPSRQHHENGLRHKGNVERFVRGLYKAGEKRKKDAEEEKREMRRIEQVRFYSFLHLCLSNTLHAKAAGAAFAQDVSAGRAQLATTASSSSSVASSSKKPKKSDGISDYSTPESLGYTDPDIERALAEAERRKTQGVAGDWQMVEPTPTESTPRTGEESTQHVDDMQSAEGDQGTSSNKRAVPDPAEEDEGRWKLRKKMATVGLGDIYDPGIITIKPKIKKKETPGQEKQPSDGTALPEDAKAMTVPKWAPVKWKKAGESVCDTSGTTGSGPGDDAVLTEGAPPVPADPLNAQKDPAPASVTGAPAKEEPSPVKLEEAITPSVEAASSGGSLFRKRKAPLGGGTGGRGRRYQHLTVSLQV